MAQERICGVYEIRSPSGKRYIGSSLRVHKRFNEHRFHLARGTHDNKHLQNAANKYGVDNLEFTLLFRAPEDRVRQLEKVAFRVYKPEYNLSEETVNFLSGLWRDPEFRERNTRRASEQNKKRWEDPEFRERSIERMRGHRHSDESKAKMSATRNEQLKDPEYRAKRAESSGNVFKKLHADPEYRAKHSARMSALMKGRMGRRDASVAHLFEMAKVINKRPVICVTTGEFFPSVAEAASGKGISVSLINKQFRGQATRLGYEWRYLTDEELVAHGYNPAKVRRDMPSPDRAPPSRLKPHKPVQCVETGLVYQSGHAAAVAFGDSGKMTVAGAICDDKTAFGYFWKYITEEEYLALLDENDGSKVSVQRRHLRQKPVACIETGIVYESAKVAAMAVGGSAGSSGDIGKMLRGKIRKALGHTWRYADWSELHG